jgi:hypothetical protein
MPLQLLKTCKLAVAATSISAVAVYSGQMARRRTLRLKEEQRYDAQTTLCRSIEEFQGVRSQCTALLETCGDADGVVEEGRT